MYIYINIIYIYTKLTWTLKIAQSKIRDYNFLQLPICQGPFVISYAGTWIWRSESKYDLENRGAGLLFITLR